MRVYPFVIARVVVAVLSACLPVAVRKDTRQKGLHFNVLRLCAFCCRTMLRCRDVTMDSNSFVSVITGKDKA